MLSNSRKRFIGPVIQEIETRFKNLKIIEAPLLPLSERRAVCRRSLERNVVQCDRLGGFEQHPAALLRPLEFAELNR